MKNVVWLKRDLRLADNRALLDASKDFSDIPYAVYIFNPEQLNWTDVSIRHWTFIFQSINDLKNQGLVVNTFFGNPTEIFNHIYSEIGHFKLYSHQESGTEDSWLVDKSVKKWAKSKEVSWIEFQNNAVIRGIKNRNHWDAMWIKTIKSPIFEKPETHRFGSLNNANHKLPRHILEQIFHSNIHMIPGGETKAQNLLSSFLTEKVDEYWEVCLIQKKADTTAPFYPHILAMEIFHLSRFIKLVRKREKNKVNKKSIDQYMARLKWHCHFIQKFEMDTSIQYKNMNSSFDSVRKKTDRKLFKAWRDGNTGYPLIDAAMRCVKETGYLNFRLRSTVVSFLTHILWQPWKPGADHLAQMFLDYEPEFTILSFKCRRQQLEYIPFAFTTQ